MVGGNDYKCFVRMLEIEIISRLNSLLEIQHLFDDAAGIVGVTCVVNVSTFNHHEEPVFLVFGEVIEATYSHFR